MKLWKTCFLTFSFSASALTLRSSVIASTKPWWWKLHIFSISLSWLRMQASSFSINFWCAFGWSSYTDLLNTNKKIKVYFFFPSWKQHVCNNLYWNLSLNKKIKANKLDVTGIFWWIHSIKTAFKKKMAQNWELMVQNPALMALIQVLNQLHHGWPEPHWSVIYALMLKYGYKRISFSNHLK